MGLFHRSNEIGDEIHVLFGPDMPFVLKAKGDRFLFRGKTYVHYIMNGEAMTLSIGINPSAASIGGDGCNDEQLLFKNKQLVL